MCIMVKRVLIGVLTASFNSHQAFAADDATQLSSPISSLHVQEGAAAPFTSKLDSVVAHRPKRVNFEWESTSQPYDNE